MKVLVCGLLKVQQAIKGLFLAVTHSKCEVLKVFLVSFKKC